MKAFMRALSSRLVDTSPRSRRSPLAKTLSRYRNHNFRLGRRRCLHRFYVLAEWVTSLQKIFLITALLHLTTGHKKYHDSKNALTTTKKTPRPLNELDHNLEIEQKLFKHAKKAKRSYYRRQWPSPNVDYGSISKYNKYMGPPPYLVYNRKTGTYYPYYNYPKENADRRNGNAASRQ